MFKKTVLCSKKQQNRSFDQTLDKLSTKFSTICPLFKQNLCCMKGSSQEAISYITQSIKELGYQGKFIFESCIPEGFRLKTKLAVRGTSDHPLIGLFKEGTHDVIDMSSCLMHHPLINQFINHLKECIKTLKIAPYDEKSHKGCLRYVQCLVNDLSKLQVVLVVNDGLFDVDGLIEALSQKIKIASLWLNHQKQISNTIFSEHFEHVYGEELIAYHVMGKTIYFHPGSFCQSNLIFFETILKDVEAFLPSLAKAYDLYSGVGLFGICLESKFEHVDFVETNLFSKLAFEASTKENSFSKGKFFNSDVKEFLPSHLDADCMIVDPPRKGLEKSLKPLLGMIKQGAYLVYVSCGYLSLVRDLKELLDLGFHIELIKGYECFPGSGEIETLCILKKSG